MKARVTITHEFELERENYRYSGGPTHDERLTDEQVKALTATDMVEYEKEMLEQHVTDIDDILADFDPTRDDGSSTIKWEAID